MADMSGRVVLAAVVSLACAGCAPPANGPITVPGGGGTGSVTTEGTPDGGSDAGSACQPAPDDDGGSGSGLVVSEVAPGTAGFVELFNRTGDELAATDLVVRAFGVDQHPSAPLAPGGRTVVSFANVPADGEVSVLLAGAVAAYACWGQLAPSADQNAAVTAGVWLSPGSCALSPPSGQSLHASGTARFASDYAAGPPTPAACP